MAKVYVGRWDCDQCGNKMIKGPETKCPNCGSSRPKDVQFYMPTEAEVVRNQNEIKKAKAGADWLCSFCETQNKVWDKVCQSCGNDRQVNDGDKFLDVKEYNLGEVPRGGKKTHRTQQNENYRQQENFYRHKSHGKAVEVEINPAFKKMLPVLGVVAVIVAVLLFIGLRSSEVSVTVERFEWNRTIAVEKYKEVTEEAWEIPSGGRELERFQAIHHHDRVSDGYVTKTRTVSEKVGTEDYVCGKRDMGNGYFEDKMCTRDVYRDREETYREEVFKKVPVYRTKYKFAIFRWKKINPVKTSDSNKNPEWGDVSHIEANENLREAGRKEVYTIVVRDEKSETHRHDISRSKWDRLTIGQSLKANRGGFGDYRGLAE
ncbi:MAG: hypothetical protein GY810_32655 [Aureispira sp.]|nr:hypothetical protein [Aureispira sp.]